jgi:hypothetical protein
VNSLHDRFSILAKSIFNRFTIALQSLSSCYAVAARNLCTRYLRVSSSICSSKILVNPLPRSLIHALSTRLTTTTTTKKQVISGVSFASYEADSAAINRTIQQTVAACIGEKHKNRIIYSQICREV